MVIDIQTGDFRQLSQQLADNSIDMFLTDPPYERKFLPEWSDLGKMAARVLRPSGWLVSYCGKMYINLITKMLDEHLEYFWQGCLREAGPNVRIWNKAVFQMHKTILFYRKAPVPSVSRRWFCDLINSPHRNKRYHKWGQSVAPFVYLIERLTDPGDLVLDPFVGGGSVSVAALLTNRRHVGFEINGEVADIARRRVEAQPPLFLPVVAEQLALV